MAIEMSHAYVRTAELEEWVNPEFERAARWLRVWSRAKSPYPGLLNPDRRNAKSKGYVWKRGPCSVTRTGIGPIRLSREAVREHYLKGNIWHLRHILVHELLHLIGVRHDYRLGFVSTFYKDEAGRVASKVIFDWGYERMTRDERVLARRVWAKVQRVQRKQRIARKVT